jgi:ElaB/YqjD/DUF883 family membrane-anchored ribosome-binding protein
MAIFSCIVPNMADPPRQFNPSPPTPPPQPQLTAWDDYLQSLGLTRDDQAELDRGTITLEDFVTRRAQAAALQAPGADRLRPQEAIDWFRQEVLEAHDQLDRDYNDRRVHMPEVAGVMEWMLVRWARCCEAEYDEARARMEQRVHELQAQQRVEEYEQLSTIQEEEEYDPED